MDSVKDGKIELRIREIPHELNAGDSCVTTLASELY